MNEKGNSRHQNFGNTAFMPKEEHLETSPKIRNISIGIPSNNNNDEKRVAITPESVNLLVETGNEVFVQKGAGLGANYTDKAYSENGASITDSPARVYGADVVIKVAPFEEREVDYLKGNQIVMSFLNVLKLNEDTLGRKLRTTMVFYL
jgi:alanine dehydrogenase